MLHGIIRWTVRASSVVVDAKPFALPDRRLPPGPRRLVPKSGALFTFLGHLAMRQ